MKVWLWNLPQEPFLPRKLRMNQLWKSLSLNPLPEGSRRKPKLRLFPLLR